MYDDAGNYVVKIRDSDLGWLTQDKIRRVTGGPGTTLLLNCRAVHGSAPNKAEARAAAAAAGLFLGRFVPLHAEPDPQPAPGRHRARKAGAFASFDTRPVEMPPDWRVGYNPAWPISPEGYVTFGT